MSNLKHSTATTVKAGPFVNISGIPITNLVIQKNNVRLSKNGGDIAAASADQGASDVGAPHDEIGLYDISLNTTDSNTRGNLRMDIQMSGCLPWFTNMNILSSGVYDSLVSGTDRLQVDVREMEVTDIANFNNGIRIQKGIAQSGPGVYITSQDSAAISLGGWPGVGDVTLGNAGITDLGTALDFIYSILNQRGTGPGELATLDASGRVKADVEAFDVDDMHVRGQLLIESGLHIYNSGSASVFVYNPDGDAVSILSEGSIGNAGIKISSQGYGISSEGNNIGLYASSFIVGTKNISTELANISGNFNTVFNTLELADNSLNYISGAIDINTDYLVQISGDVNNITGIGGSGTCDNSDVLDVLNYISGAMITTGVGYTWSTTNGSIEVTINN